MAARVAAVSLLASAACVLGIVEAFTPAVHAQEVVLAPGLTRAGFHTEVRDVGLGAEMVGFTWSGGSRAGLEVRAVVPGSGWTDWLHLEGEPTESPDATSPEFRPGRVAAGPAWLGHDVRHVQVRLVEGVATDLSMIALDSEPAAAAGVLSVQVAGALPAWPAIVPRAEWGADESWRTFAGGECDGRPRYAADVRLVVVHHTVSSNSYGPGDSAALIRGIYHFHTHTNLWCDIAYNFLVDRFGTVFEGRAGGVNRTVIGGHTGGFNTSSTGVSVIGDFTSTPVPTAVVSGLRRLLVWKAAYHGIDPLGRTSLTAGAHPSSRYPAGQVVSLPTIDGHRDTNVTGCPGQYLYALLPALRQQVAAGIAAVTPDQRLTCDWDGDGDETQAFYERGRWFIRNATGEGVPDIVVDYGTADYRAVCGDWNGDGTDTIGVYHRGVWWLRNSNSPGPPDIAVRYGDAAYTPIVGDWDGAGGQRGSATIGAYYQGSWYLRNSNTPGPPDTVISYGTSGYRPVVGDWDGDGRDTIGVFDNGTWHIRNRNTGGAPQITSTFGRGTDTPLSGDWNRDGRDSIGVARGAYWLLSNSTATPGVNVNFPY